MVVNCVAYGCTNLHDKYNKNLSFHTFPFSRPDLLRKWIVAIRRDNWRPSRSSRICSDHFQESDFQIGPYCRRKLKENAVPSIFNFEAKPNPHINIYNQKLLKRCPSPEEILGL